MRRKVPKLITSFSSTTAAMAAEAADSPNGRLIPKPQELGAGCGLAWSTDPLRIDILVEVFNKNSVSWEDMKVVNMYEL